MLISFAIHAILFMMATTHHLNKIRVQQGELIIAQLSEESLSDLINKNAISLALLVNRYANLPNIASIHLADANGQLLASAGKHKTQANEIMTKDIKYNDKVVGQLEVAMIETGSSEILNNIWWAMLVSSLIHIVLGAIYFSILRPRRSEHVQNLLELQHMIHETEFLKQALKEEQDKTTELLKELEINTFAPSTPVEENPVLALNIRFYDPKNLLNNVSPSLSQHYFQTCQVLLDRSIELCCQHYNIALKEIHITQPFSNTGATITLSQKIEYVSECLLLINAVSNLLLETLYQTYRQHKRFALPTCSAIATEMTSMQLNAVNTAERLSQYVTTQQSAVYLTAESLRQISKHYQLIALENPSNALMRQAFLVTGMDSETAVLASHFRSLILQDKSA